MGRLQIDSTRDFVEVPFQVSDPHRGARLDAFLTARLHRYSRAAVQRLIAEGRVLLRGQSAKASARVAEGDLVLVRYPRRPDPPALHEALLVLYEDEHIVAVHKPGDVLSHPTDKVLSNTATAILRRQFPGQSLHLAHRLDRETSGVLLLAKTKEAARELTRQFTAREVRKEYLAIVAGRVAFQSKTVDMPIGREGKEIKVRQAAGVGEPAVTEFERVSASDLMSLVRARPRTGRLHQIRVHLAHLGHPVLGDKLYTGDAGFYLKACRHELSAQDLRALGAPRQMLHACKLSLKHPITGFLLELKASLPEDFSDCLGSLLNYGRPEVLQDFLKSL